MINVAPLRAALHSIRGDRVELSKAQVAEMLLEIEIGQKARRALTGVNAIVAIANGSTATA